MFFIHVFYVLCFFVLEKSFCKKKKFTNYLIYFTATALMEVAEGSELCNRLAL